MFLYEQKFIKLTSLLFLQHTCTTGGGFGWMSGAINTTLNWRWTFRTLGIAGLICVPIALIALWEPKRVKENRKARRKGKHYYSIKVL